MLCWEEDLGWILEGDFPCLERSLAQQAASRRFQDQSLMGRTPFRASFLDSLLYGFLCLYHSYPTF